MKIIKPLTVTTSNLTASNVAITETAWTAGTYNTGDQRYVGTTLYEVVASPSTSDDPETGVDADPPTWLDIGQINRFSMFDGKINSQTTNTGTIEVEVTPSVVVNSLALFNMSGTNLNVTMVNSTDGTVYDEDFLLQDNTLVTDWFAYFFEPIAPKKDLVITDLPNYSNSPITVTLDAGINEAAIGEMVIGSSQNLGLTVYGTSVSIKDYSRKERDAFGNAIIVGRNFSKIVDYEVKVESTRVAGVNNLLSDYRITPIVFIGNENREETIVYGYYRDYNINLSTPSLSDMTIEVEGLV